MGFAYVLYPLKMARHDAKDLIVQKGGFHVDRERPARLVHVPNHLVDATEAGERTGRGAMGGTRTLVGQASGNWGGFSLYRKE